ncbi:hypothetical protein WR25_27089 [Diploscapter pachys]|uniref:Cytochrome P450 n=1 Tax=Diploscapter pachys TaxID=2018661 RepID=A0A2A2LTL1_9BILA|nr:hypothetical protein WR25_27089 [Diploscapter pachys]
MDTSTHVISWGILYILHHPEVARRIREELDSKICGDRIVTLDDKNKLPYTNAVINVFPDPYKFKPERFLDSEGNLKKIEEV